MAGLGSGVCTGSYQVAGVGGAGALLGDAHAEAGQAAIGVAGAQVEVVGLAVAAGRAFHPGLGGWIKKWVQGAPGRPVFPATSSSSGSPFSPHAQALAPISCCLTSHQSPSSGQRGALWGKVAGAQGHSQGYCEREELATTVATGQGLIKGRALD